MTDRKTPFDGAQLEREAQDLISMALLVAPEGEGMDLVDREYGIENIIRLRSTLGRMYEAIKVINRALAAAWIEDYGDSSLDLDDFHWWTAPTKNKKFQEGMARPFAEWLKAQSAERIERIISASGLKVSGLGAAERDTFLDESFRDTKKLIQYKPIK